jgi:hypothetical protein
MPGDGGTGDGGPSNAASLGQACTQMMACPTGYVCASLRAMAAAGFCTLTCGGAMDMTTCSNGYPGPGQGVCALALTNPMDPMGMGTPACGIACGPEILGMGMMTACPAGLMCGDLNMNMMNDLCTN